VEISYNKKKQELRSDPLVDSLLDAKKLLREHGRNIGIGVVGGLIVALVVVVWVQMRSSAQLSSEESFGRAMAAYDEQQYDKALSLFDSTANEHKGTPHAAYAAYMAGSLLLDKEQYDAAIAWFGMAASGRSTGFVGAAALEGLSSAWEGKGDLSKALEYGRKALADSRLSFRHPALRWRLALISRELRDYDQVTSYCQQIIDDTLAAAYQQKAQNLVAEVRARKGT
jgi:tetratricopeptide (TPR) repeat protein